MFFNSDAFIFQRNFSSMTFSGNEILFISEESSLLSLEIERNSDGIISNVESKILHGLEKDIVNICSSGIHSLVLKTDGTVLAWGRNNYCQCGQKDFSKDILEPTQIKELNNIIQISCGTNHSVALDNTGCVWRWGTIHNTTVSTSWDNSPHETPYKIEELEDIIWINCGQEFFYALDKYGNLWGYGSNYYGALGNNNYEFASNPVIVFDNFQNVTSIHTCFNEAYAITNDRKVIRWTFKREKDWNESLLKPEESNVLKDIIAITSTSLNAVALSDKGDLWSWGDNFSAALGQDLPFDITSKDFFSPKKIALLPKNAISATISSIGSIALYKKNVVWSWGTNFSSSTPVKILPEIDFKTRTPIRIRTAYKKYFIAFLDILGFKNMILNQGLEMSLVIKSKMDLLANLNDHFKYLNTNVMLMSDSIVVTIAQEVENSLVKFLATVAEINSMLNGSVLRGAISYGDLYHQDNIVFGPSFITAYQMQEHEAIFPRIIIQPFDIKSISSLSVNNNEIIKKYFLLDDDKKIFFDYLSFLRDVHPIGFGLDGVMSGLTNAIMTNYFSAVHMDKHIAEKYNWLLKYLFIWQLKNPLSFKDITFFKFSIVYYDNKVNIVDLQNCLSVFYNKIIVKHNNCVLLTTDDKFPYNIPAEQSYNDFLNVVKSQFIDENIFLTNSRSNDFFKSFGIQIYNDCYEKRDIFEISKYSCFETDCENLISMTTFKWVDITKLSKGQRDLLLNLNV